MQQRVGPSEHVELLHAPRQLVVEPVEPGEQPIAQRSLLRRRLDPGRGERLEGRDGIAHVRREEGSAQRAAVVATLRQQRVAGGAGVELGDEFHGRHDALGVWIHRLHGPVPQVFVHVPHPLPAPVGHRGEQVRTAVAQPDGRQPAPQHELVASPEPGVEALEHERARAAVRAGAQAVDARLQPRDLDGAAGTRAVQRLLEGVAQLARARLRRVDDGAEQCRAQLAHLSSPSSRMASVSRP